MNMALIIRLLINTLAIYIASLIIPGVQLGGLQSAVVVAIVLGVINAVVRPVLLLLTLPINFLTLGLFTFFVNALMVLLTSYIVEGFDVASLLPALLFSILISLVSSVLTWIAK